MHTSLSQTPVHRTPAPKAKTAYCSTGHAVADLVCALTAMLAVTAAFVWAPDVGRQVEPRIRQRAGLSTMAGLNEGRASNAESVSRSAVRRAEPLQIGRCVAHVKTRPLTLRVGVPHVVRAPRSLVRCGAVALRLLPEDLVALDRLGRRRWQLTPRATGEGRYRFRVAGRSAKGRTFRILSSPTAQQAQAAAERLVESVHVTTDPPNEVLRPEDERVLIVDVEGPGVEVGSSVGDLADVTICAKFTNAEPLDDQCATESIDPTKALDLHPSFGYRVGDHGEVTVRVVITVGVPETIVSVDSDTLQQSLGAVHKTKMQRVKEVLRSTQVLVGGAVGLGAGILGFWVVWRERRRPVPEPA